MLRTRSAHNSWNVSYLSRSSVAFCIPSAFRSLKRVTWSLWLALKSLLISFWIKHWCETLAPRSCWVIVPLRSIEKKWWLHRMKRQNQYRPIKHQITSGIEPEQIANEKGKNAFFIKAQKRVFGLWIYIAYLTSLVSFDWRAWAFIIHFTLDVSDPPSSHSVVSWGFVGF